MYLESRITFSLIIGARDAFCARWDPEKLKRGKTKDGEEVTIIFLVKKPKKNPRKGKQDFVYDDGAKTHKKQYSFKNHKSNEKEKAVKRDILCIVLVSAVEAANMKI